MRTVDSRGACRAESAILRKLHHPNVIDVRQTHVWERQQILIIEEELLEGSDVLDAAKDAIKGHGFKMTESFAAQVRTASRCRFVVLKIAAALSL